MRGILRFVDKSIEIDYIEEPKFQTETTIIKVLVDRTWYGKGIYKDEQIKGRYYVKPFIFRVVNISDLEYFETWVSEISKNYTDGSIYKKDVRLGFENLVGVFPLEVTHDAMGYLVTLTIDIIQ
ncbi:hypothetical protein HPMBJEAJ_00430 [Aeromonas phage avDM6]|nr:hypothetical protein HPMBJEAJ_00430 [Aeromonas phage avDM6]